MFSPNQLYDYLRYYCHANKKDAVVLNFLKNGSKDLADVSITGNEYIDSKYCISLKHNELSNFRTTHGCLLMLDQEPLDINAYYLHSYKKIKQVNEHDFRLIYSPADFLSVRAIAIHTSIIAISDYNSDDASLLKNNFNIIVRFWSNAITSRFWFSHYELLQKNHNNSSEHYRLGCYIRDTTGTREYRNELLTFFENNNNNNNNIFCPILSTKSFNVPSVTSANIPWLDHNKFDIQIVAETIFNSRSIHLTEKVFKPIVMHQAFILVAPTHSLKFMRSYGFKTFDSCWSEHYDDISNATERISEIKKLIKHINELDHKSYQKLIQKTEYIIEFNRKHFYSERFKNSVLDELHDNLENAFRIQKENFYKFPGGPLFHYHDQYFKETNKLPTTHTLPLDVSRKKALEYVYSKSKSVGDAIVKKYNHLL